MGNAGLEGADAIAADLATCSHGMLRIVAEWMLEHGWTEPLDSEPREAASDPKDRLEHGGERDERHALPVT